MSIEDDVALLERVPTLRLLGTAALRMLAIGSEQRDVARGDLLFNEGDDADAGFVVQRGALRVEDSAGAEIVVGRCATAARRIHQPHQPDRQRYSDGRREAEYLTQPLVIPDVQLHIVDAQARN